MLQSHPNLKALKGRSGSSHQSCHGSKGSKGGNRQLTPSKHTASGKTSPWEYRGSSMYGIRASTHEQQLAAYMGTQMQLCSSRCRHSAHRVRVLAMKPIVQSYAPILVCNHKAWADGLVLACQAVLVPHGVRPTASNYRKMHADAMLLRNWALQGKTSTCSGPTGKHKFSLKGLQPQMPATPTGLTPPKATVAHQKHTKTCTYQWQRSKITSK